MTDLPTVRSECGDMRFRDHEVERFYRYWKMMDALEREQQQRDYQDKKNGKVKTHGVCTGTRANSNGDAPEGNRDGVYHD